MDAYRGHRHNAPVSTILLQDNSLKPANQRGAARLAAVQALYQMDVGRATLEDTLAQFGAFHLGREVEGEQYLPADADFFRQIVTSSSGSGRGVSTGSPSNVIGRLLKASGCP